MGCFTKDIVFFFFLQILIVLCQYLQKNHRHIEGVYKLFQGKEGEGIFYKKVRGHTRYALRLQSATRHSTCNRQIYISCHRRNDKHTGAYAFRHAIDTTHARQLFPVIPGVHSLDMKSNHRVFGGSYITGTVCGLICFQGQDRGVQVNRITRKTFGAWTVTTQGDLVPL